MMSYLHALLWSGLKPFAVASALFAESDIVPPRVGAPMIHVKRPPSGRNLSHSCRYMRRVLQLAPPPVVPLALSSSSRGPPPLRAGDQGRRFSTGSSLGEEEPRSLGPRASGARRLCARRFCSTSRCLRHAALEKKKPGTDHAAPGRALVGREKQKKPRAYAQTSLERWAAFDLAQSRSRQEKSRSDWASLVFPDTTLSPHWPARIGRGCPAPRSTP